MFYLPCSKPTKAETGEKAVVVFMEIKRNPKHFSFVILDVQKSQKCSLFRFAPAHIQSVLGEE
jgi:hypothetical protein